MSKIEKISARKILDSRGEWTIEVIVRDDAGRIATASVPQGKSRGSYEACSLDADIAISKIKNVINNELVGFEIGSQEELDKKLIELDGTKNKENLGGNSTLAVSVAVARLASKSRDISLWRYLREQYGLPVSDTKRTRLYVNVINGGAHAGNNLDFQEYMIIPKETGFREATEVAVTVYRRLKERLVQKFGPDASLLGDEGGFAPDFKDNLEPFQFLQDVVRELELDDKVDFGTDVAASGIGIETKDLMEIYGEMAKKYGVIYIEDPFEENDFANFAELKNRVNKNIVIAGDDLTVTNVERMEQANERNSINGMIVKPNQIGTVTESFDAVRKCREFGWSIVCSHRSGETEDSFISDFAFAVGADGLKLGAPARGERTVKYNRLMGIDQEEELRIKN